MTYEVTYHALNLAIMPAWGLLLFVPSARITERVVHSGLFSGVFAVIYIIMLARGLFFGAAADGAGMSDINGVMALFSHPNGILIGWAHFLAFDLLVGSWVTRDGLARGVPRWLMVPSQLLTFLFGPVGLFLHLVLRTLFGKAPAVKQVAQP